jgi:hypothetical protein
MKTSNTRAILIICIFILPIILHYSRIQAQTFEKVIATGFDDVALDAIELEGGGFVY